MLKTIIIDDIKIKLNPADTLGVGGEATVVRVGNDAVKIFHNPSSSRAEKLRDFLRLGALPSTVCSPSKLAYDSTRRRIVGYVMRRLSPQYQVMQSLASKKFRRKHPSITSATITDTLLSGHETIEQLHKMGIIIGDNNDLNAFFWKTRMVYIDADSFQFQHHPCSVGTEHFLDPRLYDKDLGTKPYFRTQDDWYAWFVMYIRSILMVHPYGGVHRDYKTIPQRAKARITFLDSGVKYPKAGLHPDLLNSSLKSMFDEMFTKGARFVPDREILIDYRDSLSTCLSCGIMYPSENSSCPQCAKVNTQQIQRQVRVVKKPGKRTVSSETLITTTGQIIWQHLSGNSIYVIAVNRQNLFLHRYSPNSTETRMALFPLKGSPKFSLFGGRYLVYNDGISDYLKVFDVGGDKLIDMKQDLHVDSFQGERSFACSKDHLLRISQGHLFRSAFDRRFRRFTSNNVATVSRDQTWISASSHSSLVFGRQRVFETLRFFTYCFDPTQLWNSPIAELQAMESIIDINTVFTSSSILLLLKTEMHGKTYVHVYLLHEDKVQFHFRVDAISSDLYNNIHGKAFGIVSSGSIVILHPTDDGVVQETRNNEKNQAVLLSETAQFVSDGDLLNQYRAGILVTGDQLVNYLTIC